MNALRIFCPAALVFIGCIAWSPRLLGADMPAAGTPPPVQKVVPPTPAPPPEFWSATFNNAATFENQGIASYRHATLVSRKLRFKGAAETVVGYTVYLPPDYERSDARYPILYFLIGNTGIENRSAAVVTKAHDLIVKGELPPFIIIGATGGQSFYGNQFEGRCQVLDFFFEELVPFVEKTYRVKTEARYRHLQGMSSGGNGAIMYALKRPDLFGTVTAIAGAFDGARGRAWAEMYGSAEKNYRPFDVFFLVREAQPRSPALRMALWVGSADTTRRTNEEFHRLLTERSIAHTYNDWNSRPQLEGVTHQLGHYYEVCGKEILEFHAEAFRR